MNKKGFEMSFAWIFSIIVGTIIIVLAIYATTKIVGTSKDSSNAQLTEEIGILLDPIETNLEEAKKISINFPDEARIFNECSVFGNFGEQRLSSVLKNNIGREWSPPETEKIFYDKYIFSDGVEQGKELNLFVKPLEMPYKIGSLIYAYTERYCFVDAPTRIFSEVNDLDLKNIKLVDSESECFSNDVKVCFGAVDCDINVDLNLQRVSKKSDEVFYAGDAFLYGAIFSEPDIYECQVTRLMKRNAELAYIYAQKSEFLSNRGCSSDLSEDLRGYANLSFVDSSKDLIKIKDNSDKIGGKNDKLSCKLF